MREAASLPPLTCDNRTGAELWIENVSKFTNEDILYLKNYYYKSKSIKQFLKYYKSLPVDLQDEKYLNSIIYHYKTIYFDFLLY